MFFANLGLAFRQWTRIQHDVRTLRTLSDRDLDDMGLTRCECGSLPPLACPMP